MAGFTCECIMLAQSPAQTAFAEPSAGSADPGTGADMRSIWTRRLAAATTAIAVVSASSGCTALKKTRLAKSPSGDVDATLTIADEYAEQGDLERAAALYSEVLASDADSVRAREGLAKIDSASASPDSTKPTVAEQTAQTQPAAVAAKPNAKQTQSTSTDPFLYFEGGEPASVNAEDLAYFTDEAIVFDEPSEPNTAISQQPSQDTETGDVEVASHSMSGIHTITPATAHSNGSRTEFNPFADIVNGTDNESTEDLVVTAIAEEATTEPFSFEPSVDSDSVATADATSQPAASLHTQLASKQAFDEILSRPNGVDSTDTEVSPALAEAAELLQEFLTFMANTEAENAPSMGELVAERERRAIESANETFAEVDETVIAVLDELKKKHAARTTKPDGSFVLPEHDETSLVASDNSRDASPKTAHAVTADGWVASEHRVTSTTEPAAAQTIASAKTNANADVVEPLFPTGNSPASMSGWRTFKRPMPTTRMEYLHALMEARDRLIVNPNDYRAWQTVDDLLTTVDPANKSLALLTLEELPKECHGGIIQRLRTILVTEQHDEIKAAAVLALGGMGEEANIALPILQEILLTGGHQSREAAKVTLACLGHEAPLK